ncbi:hypothetical protein Tco_0505528 [Tanacetum coccineum]
MTRNSTKELFTPFKESEQELQSSRKHLKTLSLDESRSPVFDLFYEIEENYEEEVTKTMEETMEQYMSKTRAEYGSGIARPKIDDKDHFELKGKILKELRSNTFSGSEHEDANDHIEKVLEIEMILFYNGLDVPTRQIRDSKGVIPTKTAADSKIAIQEMAEYSQKWHNGTSRARTAAPGFYQRNNTNPSYQERRQSMEDTLSKFMSESAKQHEKNSDLNKQFRASTDAAIKNHGALIKTLEVQIGKISQSISSTDEADLKLIRRIGSDQYAVSDPQNRRLMFESRQTKIPFPNHLNDYYCDEEKGSYGP